MLINFHIGYDKIYISILIKYSFKILNNKLSQLKIIIKNAKFSKFLCLNINTIIIIFIYTE